MHTEKNRIPSWVALAVVSSLALASACKSSSGPEDKPRPPGAPAVDPSPRAAPPQTKREAEQPAGEPRSAATKEPPMMFAGAHILIAFKGSMQAPREVDRTRQQAEILANELAERARREPERFAELANRHSDGLTGANGGYLGVWAKGRMVKTFDQAVERLAIGEVGRPIETPFGFHIIRRLPLPPVLAGSHLLVAYKGAKQAGPHVTRTREEAATLAKRLAEEARRNPQDFPTLVRKQSDGVSASRGGRLGRWYRGQMIPAFEEAVERVRFGEITDPVESPFGFHVIRREAP